MCDCCRFDSKQQWSRIFDPEFLSCHSPLKEGLGRHWPPVSPLCVLGWVAVGNPLGVGGVAATGFGNHP